MQNMKRSMLLFLTTIIIFLGAGSIAYRIKEKFKTSCYAKKDELQDYRFRNEFNTKFVAKEYTEIKDLGKSFLSILIAVFVASITFSEKIVNYNSTSWWAKSLLIICWVLLLLSVVMSGTGMVFIASCFNQALYVPCPDNIDLYVTAFFCFVLAGLAFGLGLTSMLCAGIISFMNEPISKDEASKKVQVKPDVVLLRVDRLSVTGRTSRSRAVRPTR